MYVKKQDSVFRVKLSRNIPIPNNEGNYLSKMVVDEAMKFAKRVKITYSWNEHTRCFIAKIVN